MILPSELQLEGFSFIYAFFQDFFSELPLVIPI